MVELRLSAAAMNDLDDIQETGIERFGPIAAADFLTGFDRKFGLLRDHSRAGQVRPEFRQDMRVLPHRPYHILYHLLPETVLIVRIIHQRRDVRRALGEHA